MALSSDGTSALVGAYKATIGGNIRQGVAYAYTTTDGWVNDTTQRFSGTSGIAYVYENVIGDSDAPAHILERMNPFKFSTTMNAGTDGATFVVGSEWMNVGDKIRHGSLTAMVTLRLSVGRPQ